MAIVRSREVHILDGFFVCVPFPWNGWDARQYPAACRPFIRTPTNSTHDDPDWPKLTYGDDCANGRAGNLRHVTEGDILLFWGLLWDNTGRAWLTSRISIGIGRVRIARSYLRFLLTGAPGPC